MMLWIALEYLLHVMIYALCAREAVLSRYASSFMAQDRISLDGLIVPEELPIA